MIRVVLDTNVVISALKSPFGLPAFILQMAMDGRLHTCVSDELFAEDQDVLHRPRLKIPLTAASEVLNWFCTNSLWVTPLDTFIACSDPGDNMVLVCAQEGQANFLVTGNVIDFPWRWANLQILTTRQFAEALAQLNEKPL